MEKNILITGITGQDGVFLASQLLKKKEYKVLGVSRNKEPNIFYEKLRYLGVTSSELENLNIEKCSLMILDDLVSLVNQYKPDHVYNLIGPGSVFESIKKPAETKKSIETSFNNLIAALIKNNNFASFFQTSSSEMFSNQDGKKLNEKSEFKANTPYAESKLYCHKLIDSYRNKYDWNMSCGILFNHESEFRPDDYLIMKIINTAINIKEGKSDSLTVGSLNLVRDWGFAGDVTDAMTKIVESSKSEDYVIGTGIGKSIKDIIEIVFSYLNLDYEEFISVDEKILRKNEPKFIVSDPKKIKLDLGWESSINFEEMLLRCIEYKLSK